MTANPLPTSPEPVRDELDQEGLERARQAAADKVGSHLCAWSASKRSCTKDVGLAFCLCENVARAAISAYLEVAGLVEVPVIGKPEGSGQ